MELHVHPTSLAQCANYRTIGLVSHASKIILERIRVKTEMEIAYEQAGFRQGRKSKDQIINLRKLMHITREHHEPPYNVLCGLQEGVRLYVPLS